VRNAAEIERAMGEFAAEAGAGLIVVPGSVIVIHRELIDALTIYGLVRLPCSCWTSAARQSNPHRRL
jgi:hypothetical protein